MPSNRAKGLGYVREVKKILESKGYKVEGPGYGVAFFDGGMKPVHKDYFGVFDLMACKHYGISGHQVSTMANKSKKIKALQENHISGYVWCRVGAKDYRIWEICENCEPEEVFDENL